jgi:hypothetical protein
LKDVGERVAVLASYVTLRSAFRQLFIERHCRSLRQRMTKKPLDPKRRGATRSLRRAIDLLEAMPSVK